MIIIYTLIIIIIGLSQIHLTKTWLLYYGWLENNGKYGIRIHALINLILGLPIMIFLDYLSGPQVVLVFFGWFLILESIFSVISSELMVSELNSIGEKTRKKLLVFSGFVHIIIGGILVMDLFYRENQLLF